MNWIKENKKLAGILGFMIFGALGLGVVLFMSFSNYTASVEEFDASNSRIKTLKSAKLFPSEENVALKEKSVSEYADKVNLLRNALLKIQPKIKPMSETEFQAKLKERAGAVKKLAEASKIPLPGGPEFALGFDEYTVSSPKSAEAAAELNVQLDVIDSVVVTLIESGIKSLDSLERTRLPIEKASTPVVAPPAPQSKSSPKDKKSKKPIITAAAAAEPVLDRYPLKLTITTDQSPFQQVVNTLSNPSKMPHFLVLRLLRIENEKQEGPLKDEVKNRRNEESPPAPQPKDGAAPGGPATIMAPVPAPHDAVTVMGEEKLKVYMGIDYIRFRPAAVSDDAAVNPAASR